MLPKVLSHQNVDRSQPFPFTIGAKISVKLATKDQNNPRFCGKLSRIHMQKAQKNRIERN